MAPAAVIALLAVAAIVGIAIQSRRAAIPASAASPGHALGPNGSEVIGPADALVLVEEYGDFQCPVCGEFHRSVEPQIRALADQGRIRFAYVPIAFIGPESAAASNAAVCAADQGKFWPYHDYLFQNQAPENSGALTPDRLVQIGADVGIADSAFDRCVRDGTHASWVSRITEDSSLRGVNQTPTVYVNGQRLADPFSAVQAITAAFASASP
jgi:protein-disulfide isomerase